MKLDTRYKLRKIGSAAALVDTTFDKKKIKMYHVNETACVIVEMLEKEDISEDQIVSNMLESYKAEQSLIEKDVHTVIEYLRNLGAIQE